MADAILFYCGILKTDNLSDKTRHGEGFDNMIGRFDDGTNTVVYRDLAEYATMAALWKTVPSLTKQGKTVTATMMQKFRDEWTNRDGVPFDFTTMKPTAADLERLVRSTGATSFGSLDEAKTLQAGLTKLWGDARAEYYKQVELGNFIHVVTDPEIREHVLAGAGVSVKAFFAHKGKSLRELEAGDTAVLTHLTDPTFRVEVTIPNREPALEAGFAAADVVTPTANAASATPTAPLTDDTEIEPGELFIGWDGGRDMNNDGQQARGLKHVLGAYLTKADAIEVAKNIDANARFDGAIVANSVELLRHMRSNGYGFSVTDSKGRNAIDVRMDVGERLDVKVFDTDDNGAYIGRVYDAYNSYYLNTKTSKDKKKDVTFDAADATAVLDYVTGNRTGAVKKAIRADSSGVQLAGLDAIKELRVFPLDGRYRALSYENEAEAEAYIRQAITDANEYVKRDFNAEGLLAIIDSGYARAAADENFLLSSPEFQAEFDAVYSPDALVREAQEQAVRMMLSSEDGGADYLAELEAGIAGDFETGFNPAFVLDHMNPTERGNEREAMMAALKVVGYDGDKLRGNDFAVNAIRERLIAFNPDTAVVLDDVEDPRMKAALQTVQDTLKAGNFKGIDSAKPLVMVDDRGVVRWEALRRTGSNAADKMWQSVSGEIGQIMLPDEDGIIKTDFEGDLNYGLVPGYTGYFSFEGDYDNRMERFRVKGFDEHLHEKLAQTVTHQMTRPIDPTTNDIPSTLDSSALNGLYHGDVYGKRLDADFMESSQLKPEVKAAIIETLSNRVRFDNQFSDYATTSAETQAKRDRGQGDDSAAFSYWKVAGETNMRTLGKEITDASGAFVGTDIDNIADTTMTGTGKTQGLIWYLTDGATVNPDGSVTPSKGWVDKDGNTVPDRTAIQKLDYFDNRAYSAWDRTQMSSNQLMTALKVDEKVNTALMAFGGWTFDDSYAVSKEFAERNKVFGATPNEESMRQLDETLHYLETLENPSKEQILDGTGMMWTDAVLEQGQALRQASLSDDRTERAAARAAYGEFLEEHGRFRPLQRGDKLSDFGGNKGTIGIVIDRHMAPDEAKRLQLEKEVAFMKANPKLDVISAPYSMLSRHNAGVVKELMSGEVNDLVDPETGETLKGAMGQLNIIVTDMKVDEKTHAYTKEDVLDGKGRKASGQLAWALQSKNAEGILNEIYGHNDAAWATYREYLIATGLDMKPDGTIVKGYTPHAGEDRNVFTWDAETEPVDFLAKIEKEGGFLEMPFPVMFKNGLQTDALPVLSASLRQNVELVDGSMRRSDFTNDYLEIYKQIGAYTAAEDEAGRIEAQNNAQARFDRIQSTIIDRQFDGGHNGKHSYIRDKIMGKRMEHSATGVAIVDPRLAIGEVGMNQAMMDSLDAKEGDVVMGFRDPVWRDGAIRAFTVKKDDTVHGVAINPIADKSHDMDFDGDTMGFMKFTTKEAKKDLTEKFAHWANMIDHGSGKDELYFQSGMDLASATAKAEKLGDTSPQELLESVHERAKSSSDPRVLKKACKDLTTYSHKLFREHGFAGDYVSLTNDETVFASFKQMVDNGAKGSAKKRSLENYIEYHNGEKTQRDARDIQYATGVKSDDTGLAGAFSQKLVSVMRNQDITAALESMYPLTQGTLQIKHDAKHAVIVNDLLTDDMNKTFQGKSLKNPKQPLTAKSFKAQLTDTLENKMKVDVNEKFIDAVTEVLTDASGKIIPLKDAMAIKGSPMDRVAYGGGYDELVELARNEESLLTGKQNKLFAPFSMRNADEKTVITKKDTQRKVAPAAPEVAATHVAEDDGIEP